MLIQTQLGIQLHPTTTQYKAAGTCQSDPEGAPAGAPLSCRRAKEPVSEGRDTGVLGQKKGREWGSTREIWVAGLEGQLSPSPVPLVTLGGAAGARGGKVSFLLSRMTGRS